ncbi:hypothetical protein LSAT2_012511 [Lamellibrachia satsuma]|nr:hypothetical protein LSAT2_012511 [Lamellibrachia satsuma]
MKVEAQKTWSPPRTLVESREEPRVYRRNRMNLLKVPDGNAGRNASMRHDDYGELPTTNNQHNPEFNGQATQAIPEEHSADRASSSHAEIVHALSSDKYINRTKSGRVVRKPDKLDL